MNTGSKLFLTAAVIAAAGLVHAQTGGVPADPPPPAATTPPTTTQQQAPGGDAPGATQRPGDMSDPARPGTGAMGTDPAARTPRVDRN